MLYSVRIRISPSPKWPIAYCTSGTLNSSIPYRHKKNLMGPPRPAFEGHRNWHLAYSSSLQGQLSFEGSWSLLLNNNSRYSWIQSLTVLAANQYHSLLQMKWIYILRFFVKRTPNALRSAFGVFLQKRANLSSLSTRLAHARMLA